MQGMQIHLRPYICLLSLLFLHLIQSSGTLTESACVTLMIDWSALISYFIFTLLQQTYGDVWKGIFRISFNRWLSKIDENFTRHWISIEPIKCTFYFWFYNSMLICALSGINISLYDTPQLRILMQSHITRLITYLCAKDKTGWSNSGT